MSMEDISLKPGDVFCVSGNMGFISKVIVFNEWLWSCDGNAKYGHSGLITSDSGDTLEALWTVKESRIEVYKGMEIVIARPSICESAINAGIATVMKEKGKIYPVWRLILHLVPALAKISIGRWKVCSELVASFLNDIGARPYPWEGATPDMLADEWHQWKKFEIVYEGVWR